VPQTPALAPASSSKPMYLDREAGKGWRGADDDFNLEAGEAAMTSIGREAASPRRPAAARKATRPEAKSRRAERRVAGRWPGGDRGR
jgi:hypothetical protein